MNRIFRILILFFVLGICMPVFSQKISIESFKLLENDLDASTFYPKKDFNNRTCAIIKVFTTETGFSFDNGALGIVEVVYKPGEVWVYVPENTLKLKMVHPKLGHISNAESDGYYWFNERLKSGKSYMMKIISGTIHTIVEEAKVQTGWLVFNSNPQGAEIYLVEENGDEKHIGTTPLQKKMPYAQYTYRAKMFNYHDVMGLAVVDKARVNIDIAPKPAFGSVSVNSNPSGARVILNGKDTGRITPCVLDEVAPGSNDIKLQLAEYAPGFDKVDVQEGQMSIINITLEARFAHVTINSLQGASIKINGNPISTSNFNGNLSEGIYDIEVSMAGYETVSKQIEVKVNEHQILDIMPKPIYGMLDISSTPMDANITINGKSYGVTPITIDELLIGDYDVVISKVGFAAETKNVTITKGATASINVKLQRGKDVQINTDKQGDEIYVDGNKVGVSPCKVEMAYGTHEVKAVREGKIVIKTINVEQGSGTVTVQIGFGEIIPNWSASVTQSQRTIIERLIKNMVKIEGGTFTMGATAEQEGEAFKSQKPVLQKSLSGLFGVMSEQEIDAYRWEKPTHQVTLSDFYIGKYEVTQEEWQAVMGDNPSYFKGDNNPVENVSWKKCQKFISKLNELTGMQFALPTESQWEYAARGGNKSEGYKYSGSNVIEDVAWCVGNSGNKTHSVGLKKSNELGLYDMSGNVWEWCNDKKGDYSSAAQTNPIGSTTGSRRILRGGSWNDDAWFSRVSNRSHFTPSISYSYYGFRLALIY